MFLPAINVFALGEKPFACDVEDCAYRASTTGAMEVHKKSHSGTFDSDNHSSGHFSLMYWGLFFGVYRCEAVLLHGAKLQFRLYPVGQP